MVEGDEIINISQNITKEADYTIGVALSLCTIVGVSLNLLSVYYFFTSQASRNDNSIFFGRVFTIIAATDALICAILFPIIDASFHYNREPHLFQGPIFCNGWGILWRSLQKLSVFLIAMISLSRLYVLVRPAKVIVPTLAWLVPLAYFLLCITIDTILYFVLLEGKETQESIIHYRPQDLTCIFHPDEDPNPKMVILHSIITVTELAIPIIPIFLSCALSLVLLQKSKQRCSDLGGSTKNQNDASLTVIIVTAVYILFDIPFLASYITYLVYLSNILDKIKIASGGIEQEMIREYYQQTYYSDFLFFYIWPLTESLCLSLKSTINPIIYICRIEGFRKFFRNIYIKFFV